VEVMHSRQQTTRISLFVINSRFLLETQPAPVTVII